VNISPDFILQVSRDGIILDFIGSPNSSLILGDEKILGRAINDVMPALALPIMNFAEQAFRAGQVRKFDGDFGFTSNECSYEVRLFVSGTGKILVIVYDITGNSSDGQRIDVHAYQDSLTNLPNRYLFQDRLKNAIGHAARKNRLVALLHIDLDNFKRINETLGYDVGDKLLCSVADRLTSSLRKTDSIVRFMSEDTESLMARVGGDEFTILLNEIEKVQDAALVCKRVITLLSEPFIIGREEVFITASIGISVYPFDSKDMNSLLRNADIAMNQAKKQGKNTYQYYSESINTSTIERFTIENKLRKALERNEFMLFYQPQIDVSTGRIIGVEALIRWLQPDLVLVKPGKFIPVTEETGLIIPIGEWILRSACIQNRAWQNAGNEPFNMTVNISGVQFQQDTFVEMVAQALCDSGLDAAYLKLELTESILMRNSKNSIKKMELLKGMGIQIAIDDFGTGYSSLAYLKRFPVEILKIDRSFIQDLVTNPDDQAIVRAIIALAHNLKIKVIAEGVETKKQLGLLRGYGCDGAQGFLICPPINSDSLEQFIREKMAVHLSRMSL
jgi:diguanylate cyclase (GGDEF)-like protein